MASRISIGVGVKGLYFVGVEINVIHCAAGAHDLPVSNKFGRTVNEPVAHAAPRDCRPRAYLLAALDISVRQGVDQGKREGTRERGGGKQL
jgi:hypothetical protein